MDMAGVLNIFMSLIVAYSQLYTLQSNLDKLFYWISQLDSQTIYLMRAISCTSS